MNSTKTMIFSHYSTKKEKDLVENVLAGDWCLLNHPFFNHLSSNVKINSHPWKDQRRLRSDFKLMDNLIKKIIKQLSLKLNSLLNENLCERAWTIILYPWVNLLVTIIFERIMLVEKAISDYKISKIKFTSLKSKNPPENTEELILAASKNILWHDQITREIVETAFPRIKIIDIDFNEEIKKKKIINSLKKKIKNYVLWFHSFMKRNQDICFHIRGTSYKDNLDLIKKINTSPFLSSPDLKPNYNKDFELRKQLRAEIEHEKIMLVFNKLIINYFPASILENYHYYKKQSLLFYPSNPKKIITYTGYQKDDFFKIYVANKLNKKVEYNIIQHGGGFGSIILNDEETLINKTANVFYTWGWEKGSSNIFCKSLPLGAMHLKKINIQKNYGQNKEIIFPISEWAPLIFRIFDAYHGFRQLDYIELINYIISNIPEELKDFFVIRLQPGNRGWNIEQRLQNLDTSINILKRNGNFCTDLNKAKISFITTNSTTLLESLYSNTPTIVYLDKKIYPINRFAKYDFENLYNANILFFDKKKAISHLTNIYDEPAIWWESKIVRKVVKDFLSKYATSKVDYNLIID